MFAGLHVPQRMPFARIDLQLIWLIGFDQQIDQVGRVVEVDILVDQTVDDQQAVISAMGGEGKNVRMSNKWTF